MAEALVSVVEHAESVTDLSFARFKAFWAEQNLKTLHLLRLPDEPPACFLGSVFGYLLSCVLQTRAIVAVSNTPFTLACRLYRTTEELCETSKVSVRAWCIFSLYTVYATQPARDNVVTRIEIPQGA
jgi:hypothetical protein